MLKLISYDITVGAKKYFMMTALLFALFIGAIMTSAAGIGIISGFFIMMAVLGSVAYSIVYVIISIMHFHSQLIGKQSYLSHTLPVSAAPLVISKFIAIFIWGFFTAATLFIFWSLFITVIDPGNGENIRAFIGQINDAMYVYYGIDNFTRLMIWVFLSNYLFMAALMGVFISLINVPFFKNRNIGVAVAVIGIIAGSQLIGVFQLLLWLFVNIDGFAAVLNDDITGSALLNLFDITIITNITAALPLFALTVYIINKHRSV